MLKRMRLKNFKSWEDTGDIALRPITGFFGTNSSGKTSLFQALLLLKQTADSPDRRIVLYFGDQRTPADLGDFASVIYEHDTERTLSVALDWKTASPLNIVDTETNRTIVRGEDMGFETTLQEIATRSAKSLAVEQMAYRVGKAQFGMRRRPSDSRYDLFADEVDFQFARRGGRPWYSADPVKYHGFPNSMRANYRNADFVADLEFNLEECLRNVYYLGPLRAYPERSYAWSGAQPLDMGEAGEAAVAAIISSRERGETIGRGRGYRRVTLEAYIAEWLRDLDLIHDFRVSPIAEGSRVHEVKVRKSPKAAEVLITDVGFGVSQILPVLALCFYVPQGSTVILEQPEIHLHPMVQSGLADIFIDAWKKRGVQILVESHSEHLLQRLQRRVAEEQIKEEEISLFFCSSGEQHSELTPLQVDRYGNITNWPENFFGRSVRRNCGHE